LNSIARLAAGLLCCLPAACASIPPRTLPDSASLAAGPIDVPFYEQQKLECGPAALAMALGWSGVGVSPDALVDEVFTPERKGSLQADLVTAARRRDRVAFEIHGAGELHDELAAGNPVVVLQNLGLGWLPRMHYAVVVGREHDGAFVLHTGSHRARSVGPRTFLNTWNRAGAWGLVVLPPARIAAGADEARWLAAIVGLEQAKRYRAAAEAYRSALARWPDSLAAAIGLANAQYESADAAGAESTLRAAVARHPDAGDAWNNLAAVLLARGNRAEATQAACRALAGGGPHMPVYESTLREISPEAGCAMR